MAIKLKPNAAGVALGLAAGLAAGYALFHGAAAPLPDEALRAARASMVPDAPAGRTPLKFEGVPDELKREAVNDLEKQGLVTEEDGETYFDADKAAEQQEDQIVEGKQDDISVHAQRDQDEESTP